MAFFRDHFLPDIGPDILTGGRVQLVVRGFYLAFYLNLYTNRIVCVVCWMLCLLLVLNLKYTVRTVKMNNYCL